MPSTLDDIGHNLNIELFYTDITHSLYDYFPLLRIYNIFLDLFSG